jgi:integrase
VTVYVDELATSGRKAAGIKQVTWAIGAMHRLGSLPDPTKAEMVRQALKRMSRDLGTRQQQAAPVRAYEVRRILETAGTRPIDQRDIALLLVMRDLLARRSKVVALDAEDISYDQDGSGIALIRRSKIDQDGQGAELYLSPNAVAHLRRWLTTAGITEGPIFRAVDKGDRLGERLQPAEVARIIKRLGLRAGLAVERISGHSCRVGMAQDLVAFGADVAGLMQAGRWKSVQMPARYSSRLTAKHGVVAQMQDKLNPVGG